MELIDFFYATSFEKELAESEGQKLKSHILSLAPTFCVDIQNQHGCGVRLRDNFNGGLCYGVYNKPIRVNACSITVTLDEEWTKQGMPCFGFYRGDSQAHLRGLVLIEQGDRSVDTSIHEWLHYYAYGKWGINVDERIAYEYPNKSSDSECIGWRHWYSALLSNQAPKKIA